MTDTLPTEPQPGQSARREVNSHARPLTAHRLRNSTMVVMIGFTLTKLVSLLQVFIIADRFGTGADYDSFVTANNAPAQIVRLLGGGALAVAFIPVFSGLLNRDDSDSAWRLASQAFNTLLVVTLVISLLIAATAPLLVQHVIAPGFNASQTAQTVDLLRILMISTVIFTVSSLLSGILNGYNHFFLPVLAPIFQDVGLLFGVIFFTGPLGIYGLAWGVVLGAVMHIGIQVPGLVMFRARWLPSLGWNDPRLREVARLMVPRMLASGVFAINFIAINNIASRLGEGAPSAFDWGLRIMDIPEALIGTALGFVIFPTLSALTELGRVEDRRKLFSEAVRFVLVATIPAAAGMLLIGRPAVDILFTDPDEAALVYASVQVFAFALVFQAVHEIIARAFYAEKDTITPLIMSVYGMIAAIITLIVAFNIYLRVDTIPLASPFGAGIAAMGYLVAFVVELSLLTIALKRRWIDLDEGRVRRALVRTFAATALMALPVIVLDMFLANNIFTGHGRFTGLARSGIGAVTGIIFFLIGALVFDLKEVKQFPRIFRKRGAALATDIIDETNAE
ncbi:MAG: murein biosynthesis integral membrane protein MurJ [Chloroflexi bacterium]|nr:murein biosynthesis integral membrane protein MurJ [Chloroflexota bacterium]